MNPLQQLTASIHEADLWEQSIELKRNEYLAVKGSTDSNLYYVESGTLRIYVVDEEEEHCIRFGYQANFFAMLDTFITGQPTDFYVQAIKKTTLKRISKRRYLRFIQQSEANQHLWNRLLEMLVYQQMERERDLLTASPVDRYKRVLARSPQLFQEIPNKYIASYLRMTPETLSRVKKS